MSYELRGYDDWKTTDPSDTPTRSTGPRRERPATCYVCGKDCDHSSAFGDPTCGDAKCRETVAGWSKR